MCKEKMLRLISGLGQKPSYRAEGKKGIEVLVVDSGKNNVSARRTDNLF